MSQRDKDDKLRDVCGGRRSEGDADKCRALLTAGANVDCQEEVIVSSREM